MPDRCAVPLCDEPIRYWPVCAGHVDQQHQHALRLEDETRRNMAAPKVAELEADNARLRALIRDAEQSSFDGDCSYLCPWCQTPHTPTAPGAKWTVKHPPTCPAFSAPGVVR